VPLPQGIAATPVANAMFWSHLRTPLFSTAALQQPEVCICNRGSPKARRLNTFAYGSI
jgi:hypothetical protein